MYIFNGVFDYTMLALAFVVFLLWEWNRCRKTLGPTLKVQKLSKDAVIPTIAEPGSIGYDLCSTVDFTLPSSQMCSVSTGVAIELPEGVYGRVAPRSGLAVRSGIDVLAGVIDPSYRGEVKVVLINHGQRSVFFPSGSRIAQLVLERAEVFPTQEVDFLSTTERGSNGFGSTGQ